jgi:hypothetical protein
MGGQESFKVCCRCEEPQATSAFSKSGDSGDGLKPFCKKCASKEAKARREKNKAREIIIVPDFKTCSRCKLEKPNSAFSKDSGVKDGLKSYCKECGSKVNKKCVEKNRNRNRETVVPEFKTCPKCKKEKPGSDFSKNVNTPDGVQSYCKECMSTGYKSWVQKNSGRETIVIPKFKTCPKCKKEKPGTRFSIRKGNEDGLCGWCKECCATNAREFKYGISEKHYQEMLAAQDGTCPICKLKFTKDNPPCVDHKHVEEWDKMPPEERMLYVRGLLCHYCNIGLGGFKDLSASMQNAIKYLEKHEANYAIIRNSTTGEPTCQ